MKKIGLIYCSFMVVIMLMVFGGAVFAAPGASVSYIETNLGGGSWQYNYSVFNTSDPFVDAGSDLYDVWFAFDSSKLVSVVSLPFGWDYQSGQGFAETYSLNPGPAPIGSDIAPGTSLSGFIFQFDYQAGPLAFDALLFNPLDNMNPVFFSGTSAAATSVPEPAMLMLLGPGLVGLVVLRRQLKK